MLSLDVRLIDACIGTNETGQRLCDQEAAFHFDDAPGLSQNQFDKARILSPLDRPGSSECGRLEFAQINHSAFGFGDDFLRHGKHDRGIDGQSFLRGGPADQGGEVVAAPYFGQRRKFYDFDAHAARKKDETSDSRVLAKSTAMSSGVSR